MITADLILRLGHRGMSRAKAETWAKALSAAAARFGITSPLRVAHWLAQIMHESAGLLYTEEIASGASYEGRADLGNTQRGDGVRFKGRGPIQLTGRANYRAAGLEFGLPLEQHPELAAEPGTGALIAARYFARHTVKGQNLLWWSDQGATPDVVFKVSWGVNGLNRQGQPNHLAERQDWFNRLWSAVKDGQPAGRVLLVPLNAKPGADLQAWNGQPTMYAGTLVDDALISQLRLLYPQPGGPWQYSPGLTVYLRRSGDLVLERTMNTQS